MIRFSSVSVLVFISIVSHASFPVDNNEVVTEGLIVSHPINDSFNTLGWIALSCLALGGILIVLQSLLAPNAFIGRYILMGMLVGGVGGILALIWLFSRFKWGRKYWWILLLSLFLLQIILEQYGRA